MLRLCFLAFISAEQRLYRLLGGDMNTEILQEFTELAKRLNFTETARVLNMSQPTLSKHISSFERDLRLELFDRSGSMLRLTRAGTALLPYAYKIIESQKDFYAEAKSLRATPPPQLRVGGFVDEELVSQTLSQMLVAMSERHGRNFLEVRPAKHRLPSELLLDNSMDIIFDYAYEQEEGIDSVRIGNLAWVAVVNKDNPLARKDSITIDDLRDETLIKIEGSHISEAWRFIEECCKQHGFAPKIRRQYSMRLTDLITTAAGLNDEVLILGENFIKRVGISILPFCQQVPISDSDATFPVAAFFLRDNHNPLIPEAIEIISELGGKP